MLGAEPGYGPDYPYTSALDLLADGRYFDGTYEWDKEGDDWTPLRAPFGMPTRPQSVRVIGSRMPTPDAENLSHIAWAAALLEELNRKYADQDLDAWSPAQLYEEVDARIHLGSGGEIDDAPEQWKGLR